jgi:hypothetical protein
MQGWVKIVVWGALGLLVAAVLSLGAFAIAGDSIGPAEPIPVPSVSDHDDRGTPSATPEPTEHSSSSGSHSSSSSSASSSSSSASEPGDDHGGDSGSGSDDSGSGSDDSGHGSDDD